MVKVNGRKLAERRLKLGLSVLDLSFKVRMHPANISRMERGYVDPKISTIMPLVRELGGSLEDFLEGQNLELAS